MSHWIGHIDEALKTAALPDAKGLRVAPALALGVSTLRGQSRCWYAGQATPHTIFDLASLTKPLTTLLWGLRLVEAGRLTLTEPIGRWIDVKSRSLATSPVWRLLNHTTGLAAHRCYFEEHASAALAGEHRKVYTQVLASIRQDALEADPGARERYSDLGFLLLAELLGRVDGSLGDVWPQLPGHSPSALHFRALEQPLHEVARYAPTEQCDWRGRLLRGEVHDDNCWAMGGLCGHAGAFGDLESVLALGQGFLKAWLGQGSDLGISPELMQLTCDRSWMHPNGTRVLGWDTPTPGRSSAGQHISLGSVGHLGFTGTSIWLDPEREAVVVLLTNRVSPTRTNTLIRQFRPLIHDLVWQWLDEAQRMRSDD
ncbi:MAG: serine hydrolase domain-containing protein [Bradymonadia bacterium]